jgi:hypothetical protein
VAYTAVADYVAVVRQYVAATWASLLEEKGYVM